MNPHNVDLKAADMWAVGCMLLEILSGVPLLTDNKEKDDLEYLQEIFSYFGTPVEGEDDFYFYEENFVNNIYPYLIKYEKPESFKDIFPFISDWRILDLLSKLLEINPEKGFQLQKHSPMNSQALRIIKSSMISS